MSIQKCKTSFLYQIHSNIDPKLQEQQGLIYINISLDNSNTSIFEYKQ